MTCELENMNSLVLEPIIEKGGFLSVQNATTGESFFKIGDIIELVIKNLSIFEGDFGKQLQLHFEGEKYIEGYPETMTIFTMPKAMTQQFQKLGELKDGKIDFSGLIGAKVTLEVKTYVKTDKDHDIITYESKFGRKGDWLNTRLVSVEPATQ